MLLRPNPDIESLVAALLANFDDFVKTATDLLTLYNVRVKRNGNAAALAKTLADAEQIRNVFTSSVLESLHARRRSFPIELVCRQYTTTLDDQKRRIASTLESELPQCINDVATLLDVLFHELQACQQQGWDIDPLRKQLDRARTMLATCEDDHEALLHITAVVAVIGQVTTVVEAWATMPEEQRNHYSSLKEKQRFITDRVKAARESLEVLCATSLIPPIELAVRFGATARLLKQLSIILKRIEDYLHGHTMDIDIFKELSKAFLKCFDRINALCATIIRVKDEHDAWLQPLRKRLTHCQRDIRSLEACISMLDGDTWQLAYWARKISQIVARLDAFATSSTSRWPEADVALATMRTIEEALMIVRNAYTQFRENEEDTSCLNQALEGIRVDTFFL